MKKVLSTAILALSMAGSALAAGLYDGIYQHPTDTNNYLSVHQNGTTLIVASYNTIQSTNVTYYSAIGNFTPARADIWDLLVGTISGNTAFLSGEIIYGACSMQMNMVFDAKGATATLLSVQNTNAGNAQGMRCADAALLIGSNVRRYPRVF